VISAACQGKKISHGKEEPDSRRSRGNLEKEEINGEDECSPERIWKAVAVDALDPKNQKSNRELLAVGYALKN